MKTILLMLGATFLLAATAARAQTSDAGNDAGDLPDATQGMGGADMNSEENNDGMAGSTCMRGGDCAQGFDCVNNVCTYTGVRNATCAGCGPGLPPIAALIGLVILRSLRQRKTLS